MSKSFDEHSQHSKSEDVEAGYDDRNYDRRRELQYEERQSATASILCSALITFLCALLVIVTFPVSIWYSLKVVKEYERVVITRLGRVIGQPSGPGLVFIIPCIDTYRKIDTRTMVSTLAPQDLLTSDTVPVGIEAVVYYRVTNPTMAVVNIENYGRSTRALAATTLQSVLARKELSELVSESDKIGREVNDRMDEDTGMFGTRVNRVENKYSVGQVPGQKL